MIDDEKVARALALIKKGPANADYFFEQLKSPEWIEPLAKERLFSHPYPAVRQADTISFPIWMPGEYLARMASIRDAQALVVEILKNLPESDNPRVYEVVADAAAALPPIMAKELISQLLRGIQLPYQLVLPEKLAVVVTELADANLGAEALRLASALFAIAPSSPPAVERPDDTYTGWVPRKAKGRIDDWHYGKLLGQCLKSLVRASGMDAFRLLCDLLEQAVTAQQQGAADGPEDYSYVWRPSIAHAESSRENVRDDLVSAVRDASTQIIASSPEHLRAVIEQLRARRTRVFHRVALYLLTVHGEQDTRLVGEALDTPGHWSDFGFHPEYELLLARYFGGLPPELRTRFLDWVDEGPDLEAYVAFRTRMDGHDPEEEEVTRHRDIWTRDHLGVVEHNLPTGYRERLDALVASLGPHREPGRQLHAVSFDWRGEQSPLTEEEALSLDWPTLIAKARDWSPPSADLDGPTEDGLARSVRQRVSANPDEAIKHLQEVVGVHPRYIAAILEALRDALKRERGIEWGLILRFLAKTVDQAHTATEYLDRWRWVSKCAASLIDDGFHAGAASISVDLREVVWPILRRLSENPDPSEEHEARYGGDNMDPATLSLNTVRGEAFHGVIRYALWWRVHLESEPDGGERLERGFDELPEVRALLERHLDQTIDPSLAVRAVYGQWFPWLVLLDSDWANRHVQEIFPEEVDSSPLFWAAWGTYIVFSNPFTNVLPILRSVYARAIRALGEGMSRKVGMGERPSEHLAEHLMAYYWQGEISLGENDLVYAFFEGADPKLRGHALEWIGRSLAHAAEPPPDVVQDRLKALWEWRVNRTSAATQELQAFGWWFGSGQFDLSWSLQMLHRLLATPVLPEPDHMVAERLAIIAETDPGEAVQSLDRMVDLAAGGWSIHGWLDSARKILEIGLNSTKPGARECAERVIHKLGALRFRDFRALLKAVAKSQETTDNPGEPRDSAPRT